MATPPNILLLITDQQRYPRHWPDFPGWLRDLTPSQHALEQNGLTFHRAFTNTSMCSPSRATLLTGRYPAQHGVTLTHTQADLRPDLGNSPAVIRELLGMLKGRNAPRRRALHNFGRGLVQAGPRSGNEPELQPETQSLAHLLRERGYEVAYKGKWHLTHPSHGEGAMLGGWTQADAERIRDEYGFADWEPPDAGENAKAEHFGAGNAGPLELGWDEVYTRQVESWLGRDDLPEPFCLVVSLVNPHDVLGYPAQHVLGGYPDDGYRELGVELPPTVTENLRDKPTVHELMKMGMAAYLGPLRTEEQRLEYVNFYAHLHRVVDEQLGRVIAALGDPSDPGSVRSRTLLFRCADHGEMGLSHGGLRQKAFNAYEETIHVPLVVSNPVLFPKPARATPWSRSSTSCRRSPASPAPSLDGRAKGRDLAPIIAAQAEPEGERLRRTEADLGPILARPSPAESVQDEIHFTYDDHQAATALQDVPGQPNRIRAIRTERAKFALYFDPERKKAPEYEMYDLERDPDESHNLVDRDTGQVRERVGCRTPLGARAAPGPPDGAQRHRPLAGAPIRSRAMDRRVIGLTVAGAILAVVVIVILVSRGGSGGGTTSVADPGSRPTVEVPKGPAPDQLVTKDLEDRRRRRGEGRRPGERPVRRRALRRRQGVRRLLGPGAALRLPARLRPGDPGLGSGRRGDEGGRAAAADHPARPGLRRPGPAADDPPERHAGLRHRPGLGGLTKRHESKPSSAVRGAFPLSGAGKAPRKDVATKEGPARWPALRLLPPATVPAQVVGGVVG